MHYRHEHGRLEVTIGDAYRIYGTVEAKKSVSRQSEDIEKRGGCYGSLSTGDAGCEHSIAGKTDQRSVDILSVGAGWIGSCKLSGLWRGSEVD